MATKSILKDVRFKDRKLCRGFATALESAKGKRSFELLNFRSDISALRLCAIFIFPTCLIC